MPYSGASRSSRASVPASIDSCSPALLPTTRISRPICAPWIQLQRLGLDEAQLLRVVAVQAEVVHRIAVHRIQLHFLAVEESRLRGHGAGGDDVAVREDQPAFGIHHEA